MTKSFTLSIDTLGSETKINDILKKVSEFYYIDHGYFNQSTRSFENKRTNVLDMNGYFRIVYNNFIHNGEGNFPNDRLKKLNLEFLEMKKSGEYILFSEPSDTIKKIYKIKIS